MGSFTLSSKTIPNLELFHATIKTLVPDFQGFLVDEGVVTVLVSGVPDLTLISVIEAISPPNASTLSLVEDSVTNARHFGAQIIVEFAAKNVILGITADGMTGSVRKTCAEVIDCLLTGSLYDAINELRAIPTGSYDSKYITAARILIVINELETYLGVTLSTSI